MITDFKNEELLAIQAEMETEFGGDELMLETLNFTFSSFSLTFSVDLDTDEVLLKYIKKAADSSNESSNLPHLLRQYLGKRIGEFWQCKNSRGYTDLVILGFDGLRPSLAILAEGACLKIYEMPSIAKRV